MRGGIPRKKRWPGGPWLRQGGPVSTSTPAPRLLVPTAADAGRIRTLEDTVWFEVQPGLNADDYVESLDLQRTRVVEQPVGDPLLPAGEGPPPLAAMYTDYPLTLTVPGPGTGLAQVPMSGLSWVAVHPDHRRRGLLRAMVGDHLHRVHDSGEAAVSGLLAAEVGIYGRFGYRPASLGVEYSLGRGTELQVPPTLAAPADEVSTRMLSLEDPAAAAVLHRAHVACGPSTLGAVVRSAGMAEVWFRDFPEHRREKEPRRVLVAGRAGADGGTQPVGYAVFRRTPKWSDEDVAEGTVTVWELGAVDPPALLALARRLLDLDLTTKVTFRARRLDDPLLWWAGGPRSTGVVLVDNLWVRLVDLPRALTDRGYAAACDVVLEVTDELCPWNAGRWRLRVDDHGSAQCERTDRSPDLSLPVAVLGACYTGGRTLASQAAAGAVEELTAGTVPALSRAMRADREPVGSIDF